MRANRIFIALLAIFFCAAEARIEGILLSQSDGERPSSHGSVVE